MKISMAALCDRATVREGLLHILGAGVTQCSLILPGAPDLDLALLLRAERWDDLAGRHSLTVTVKHEDGTQAGKLEMGWESPHVDVEDTPTSMNQPLPQLPIVVPLRGVPLTKQGEHQVQVHVDNSEIAALSFLVTKAELPGVTVQLR
ncbi:DUF6941 family protein [Streptomyces sp. NPDC093094]|uniref:DUF6941 family protein n=1 Tax=Streptomyces sp. NPDC093094 TaxID=3366026 RepID=UPI00380F7A49